MPTLLLVLASTIIPILAITLFVQKRDRTTQYMTLLITVAGTFAGVWLGIYQADKDKRKDEVTQVIALTDAALQALGAEWTFSRYQAVPFLDQMAGNPLVPRYYDPKVFSVLPLFNVIQSDEQFRHGKDRENLYSRTYYELCLQRGVLNGSAKIGALKKSLVEGAPEPTMEDMRKVGCYIDKPYGLLGAP